MKRLLFLALPALMYAEGLKSLLDFAVTQNNIVVSKILIEQSKMKDIESSQGVYYPTIDAGAFYQNLNSRTPGFAGDVYSGYVKVGVDLYDGGRKKSTIEKNKALLEASKYDTYAYKKSLQLQIVQDFFNIQSAKESLKALKEKNEQLKAEVYRVRKFYEVGSATKDDVDRLQAALSNNTYLIDTIKFQIHSLKRVMSLKIGKKVSTLEDTQIQEPLSIEKNRSDEINVLKEQAKSLQYTANSVNSAYKPQVRFEDTFNLYDYGRSDVTHFDGVNHQNKLMLSFNIRLFDNGVVSKKKESIIIQKMALQKQIKQLEDAQDINLELALSKIKTIKAQIKSAKSSLTSANSAYITISQKFKAGIVDNVTYLDALSVKTNSKSLYQKALNDIQIAYASYYYYLNKNIKDYIK